MHLVHFCVTLNIRLEIWEKVTIYGYICPLDRSSHNFFKRSGVGCSESHHLLAERRADEQVQIKSGSPNHEQVGWGT